MTGVAYHAGALAAIEHDLGWDPNDAEVVVGTSAGALIGAILRNGVPAHDLARVTTGSDPVAMPPRLAEDLMESPRSLPPLGFTTLMRQIPRVPDPALIATWVRNPTSFSITKFMAACLPDGRIDGVEHLATLGSELGEAWPRRDTWLTATRRSDYRRVVFGRDRTVPLHLAVAASTAVPGYFGSVQIDGRTYVDGGVVSPTNADTLVGMDLDRVFVMSPLSGRHVRGFGPHVVARRLAARTLAKEVRALEAEGTEVVIIEPSAELIETLGPDFMDHTRLEDIAREAFFDTGAQLAGIRRAA